MPALIRRKQWQSGKPKPVDRRLRGQPRKPAAKEGEINSLGIFHAHPRVTQRSLPANPMSHDEAGQFATWAAGHLATGDWYAVYNRICSMMFREHPNAAERCILEMFSAVPVPATPSPEPWIAARILSVHMESGQWQQIAPAWRYAMTLEAMPDNDRGAVPRYGAQ